MSKCPCGSGQRYAECCEPFHTGTSVAKTAEALMRSRYAAYVKNEITYLGETLHPEHRQDWDEANTRTWSQNSQWLGLEIITTEHGLAGDTHGVVEFAANYLEEGAKKRHHEISNFQHTDGRWYYVDGALPKVVTKVNEGPKIGRNSPCSCGSGKKFKKCCGG